MSFSNIDYYRDQIKVTTLLETDVLDDRWITTQTGGRSGDKRCSNHCPFDCNTVYDRPNCGSSCGPNKIYDRNYTYFTSRKGATEACHDPFTCRVRGYQRRFDACGEFEGTYSCGVSIGGKDDQLVVGNCTNPDSCKRGKDGNCDEAQWNSYWITVDSKKKPSNSVHSPTLTNNKKGCANCQYTFDTDTLRSFKFINYVNDADTKVYPWMKTVLTGKGKVAGSFKTLPDTIKIWLKNTMIISLSSHYWFQGFYEGWGLSGDDDHWDFISIGDDSSYIHRRDAVCLTYMQLLYAQYYPSISPPGFPSDLLTCLKTILEVPKIEVSGDDVYIILPLNSEYFNEYTLSSDKSSYLSNLFSWILDDKSFKYSPKKSVSKAPGFNVDESATTINSINVTIDTETFGCTTQGVPYKDFTDNKDGKYTYNFVTSYNVKCKITKWTAMLMVFALSRMQDQLTDNTISQMSSDTEILTVKRFKSDCSSITPDNRSKCLNYVTTYCQNISNNTAFSDSLIGVYVFNGNLGGGANACNCYNSNVQPPVIAYPGNPTAMCFDTNCDNDVLIDLFGLSPDFCKTKCSEMWNWMFNANPTMGKPVPQFFNSARYSDVCGKNYHPTSQSGANIILALYMAFSSLLILLCIYLSLKYYNVSNKTNYITIGITGAIFVGITVFILIDTRGNSVCEGTTFPQKSVCKSSITGTSIPNEFCNFMSACECQTDSDCKGDCECSSQVCIPTTSVAKQKITLTQKSKVSYWGFAFTLLLIILIIIIFALVYIVYNNIYLALFILCTGLSIVLFASISQFTKVIDAKFGNSCGKDDFDNEIS